MALGVGRPGKAKLRLGLAPQSEALRSAPREYFAAIAIVALSLLLSGCATMAQPSAASATGQHPSDPWERTNRSMFSFNDAIDQAVVKPLAVAYVKAVPEPVREAVSNFFGNLEDAWSAVNWLLQAEFKRGAEQGARFAWNSTIGLAGLFDLGHHLDLQKRSQDFGQTLGAWGFGPGPYVVLPILGPSSIRDTVALPINGRASGATFLNERSARVLFTTLELSSQRADFLTAEKLVEGIALDKYTFFRDAYLQRRGGKGKVVDETDFELIAPKPAANLEAKL